jgi:hypothetical protein
MYMYMFAYVCVDVCVDVCMYVCICSIYLSIHIARALIPTRNISFCSRPHYVTVPLRHVTPLRPGPCRDQRPYIYIFALTSICMYQASELQTPGRYI